MISWRQNVYLFFKLKVSIYGKGSPDNIITDDTQAERDGQEEHGPTQQ